MLLYLPGSKLKTKPRLKWGNIYKSYIVVSPTNQQKGNDRCQSSISTNCFGLPELHLQQILSIDNQEVHPEASPVIYKQPSLIRHSEQDVKRDGRNKPHKIRHLSILGRKSYVYIPSIRLVCTRCQMSFVWTYDFVGPKHDTAELSVSKRSNKSLAPQQLIVQKYKEHLRVRYSGCIKKHTLWKLNISLNKLGTKHRTPQVWYWASMILPLKKDIRTTQAFIIFGAKLC